MGGRIPGVVKPIASIVVPAWDSGERIVPTLNALTGQDFAEPFEIVVVDSGETGCGAHVHERFPAVRFEREPERLLTGAARNRGVAASTGRWIAFCSDDCVPGPDWLALRVAKHREGHDVVGGSVTNGAALNPIGWADYYTEHTALLPSQEGLARQGVPHLLSYDRAILERAGPFPEDTPTGEDSVLNQRCLDAGASVGFEPRASFAHRGPAGLRGYLGHHARHGRGLARCVELHDHDPPPGYGGLVVFPVTRWARGLRRVASARPAEVPAYLAVSPIIACGHLAVAIGARRERSG